MDIALRKHLIDIQEIIANPPAAKSRRHRMQRDTCRPRLGLELAVDVPGADCAVRSAPDCLAPDARQSPLEAGRAMNLRKQPSPTGSARSSLSRSRGRLLVVRQVRRKSLADSDSALVAGKLQRRRTNLGTCMGKLSLLRLRQLAQSGRRAKTLHEDELDADEDEDAGRPEAENIESKVAGRRQLRLAQAGAGLQLKAPNGTQLLVSRPLAALNDETQLYAIPRKSKCKESQVNKSSPTSAIIADSSKVSRQIFLPFANGRHLSQVTNFTHRRAHLRHPLN